MNTAAAPISATGAAFLQFICRACGYVYDEALGDPDGGLAPGTRLQDIPDDWACPLCGVTKADFEPYDPAPRPQQAARPMQVNARRSATARKADGVVIVGGGTAAWALVEQIRKQTPDKPITLVAACSADRYDKPRLSVAIRQGVAPQALPTESGADAAARWGVRLMAQTRAVGLNLTARRLRTTRGTVAFEHLVLAHGAQARSCDGLPDELTWRINDLGAYQGLRAALVARSADAAPARVVIVGSGLVGCELANDLALAGHPVTLLDQASRPLPMATPEQSADLLRAWAPLPIRFLAGAAVRHCSRERAQPLGELKLLLDDGQSLQADVLVSAVGLRTPSSLALQAGLRWDNGIAVDPQTLSTGQPHVHALGDCISIDGRPQRFIEPIRRQAQVLAARLCGQEAPAYDATLPPIRVKTSSLPLTLAA